MMIESMTGFGSKEAKVAGLGTISVEIRSLNHKFLETVVHLPEGFLSLEEKVKKEIEAKVSRGRITCAINLIEGMAQAVSINKALLNNYLVALRSIRGQFHIKDQVRLDTLINLPGILSLAPVRSPQGRIWPDLKKIIHQALNDLVKMRRREGRALYKCLQDLAHSLGKTLTGIERRFKDMVKKKASQILLDEERASFLKSTDITEELQRLAYHVRNFKAKIAQGGPVGKELDFIAQEMQREANTISAKACDALISSRVVEIKSQIEKIREQIQNVE